MIKRISLSAMLLLALSGCADSKPEPNILLIVLDDLGYNDLAINNNSNSPTPNLDQFARQGLRFTRHYAESSCTVARVALLTGQSPAHAGAHPNLNGIDEEFVTLADALAGEGYTNYMLGKWHTGDAHELSRPEHQGFHHWFGFMNQLYLGGPHPEDGYRRGRPTYRNPWLEDESGNLQRHKGHLTNLITKRALEVIRSEENKWFMHLAYYAPHDPIQPGPAFAARHSDDPTGRYQALKEQLDASIGRIMKELRDSGALENTIVMIVSDNGGTARDWPSNLPFHGVKTSFADGGVRTPLLISWPGQWPVGEVREDPVSITDIYPTLMEAIGAEIPAGLEGRSLFAAREPRVLRWYSHRQELDRYSMLSADGEWRLIAWGHDILNLQKQSDFTSKEPINRANEEPERAASMRDDMKAWIRSSTEITEISRSDNDGFAHYRGSDLRRTPISGAHTLGLVLRQSSNAESEGPHRIAEQAAYIDISYEEGTLAISIDGQTQQVPTPDTDCFTLFVASNMVKSNMIFDNYPSESRIYLDGELAAQSSYSHTVLNQATPRAPLSITTSNSAPLYQADGAEVVLSTRMLGAEEIAERTRSLKRAHCGD